MRISLPILLDGRYAFPRELNVDMSRMCAVCIAVRAAPDRRPAASLYMAEETPPLCDG